ncbi:hypothetical protein J7M23_01025 [Candidatus Sumerlaeota bacterium]|nr:hypothetical protein [Candidatus Sumerlaeota bacterium]
MEKTQYELCIEVLRRFARKGILNHIILIGSGCIPFYKEYFQGVKHLPTLRTRDIDFLVPAPSKLRLKVDIPELLKDLAFVVGFKAPEGFIRLEHPELIIDFLVPEKGKGLNKPFPLPQLGINAQPLRFLNLLSKNTIQFKTEGFTLKLPHPANFALHKLLISSRRHIQEKAIKDRNAAIQILKALMYKGESNIIKNVFDELPQKWQRQIIRSLETAQEQEVLSILK